MFTAAVGGEVETRPVHLIIILRTLQSYSRQMYNYTTVQTVTLANKILYTLSVFPVNNLSVIMVAVYVICFAYNKRVCKVKGMPYAHQN